MKIIFVTLVLFISTFSIIGQGIVFLPKETPWIEVLQKAKVEQKIIFIDFYTDWCGPCKMMDNKIFPLKSIGEEYNTNFINVKINAEKGEGIALSKQYNIQAYPTFLFVDSEGSMVHTSVGAKDSTMFMELALEGKDPNRQYGVLKNRFLKKELQPEELKSFANTAFCQESDIAQKAAEAYLDTQDDWTTTENIKFIAQFLGDVESVTYQFLLENKAVFETILGKPHTEHLILSSGSNSVKKFYDTNEKKIDSKASQYLKNYVDKNLSNQIISYAEIVFDQPKPEDTPIIAKQKIKRVESHLDQYSSSMEGFLNFWAWEVYEQIDDLSLFKKALVWSLKSIETQDVYMTNDTAAALYFKLGNKEKAMEYAKRAIDRAATTGENTEETQELIKKIEGM